MRAGAVAAFGVGIVLVIVGIVVAVAYSGSGGGLGVGIAILVIGVILGAVGGASGASRSAPRVAQATSPQTRPAGSAGGEMMVAMVQTLAQMPEPQRREMMRTRLNLFNQMPDGERVRGMQGMMQATQVLDPEAMKRLTFTRLESLAEDFDPASRKRLMATHMQALMGMPPEAMRNDLGLTVSVMNQCHEGCRMKDMATMKELVMELPADRRQMLMGSMPPEIQSMVMG